MCTGAFCVLLLRWWTDLPSSVTGAVRLCWPSLARLIQNCNRTLSCRCRLLLLLLGMQLTLQVCAGQHCLLGDPQLQSNETIVAASQIAVGVVRLLLHSWVQGVGVGHGSVAAVLGQTSD